MSLVSITAKCKNGKSHTLLWEKRNIPCPEMIKHWFCRFFGPGQWKIKLTEPFQKVEHKNSSLFTNPNPKEKQ